MCVLSIKVPIRKKSGNLFNDPRMLCHVGWLVLLLASGEARREGEKWLTRPFMSPGEVTQAEWH